MSNNPGFDILKQAFKKFAAKYANEDMGGSAMRIAAAGGKAAIDSATQEFPPAFVSQVATDLYGLLTSQDVADGVSATVRSIDAAKIQEWVDTLTEKLKEPETAAKIAQQIKQVLNQADKFDLTEQLDSVIDLMNLPMGPKLIAQALLGQIKPILQEMKDAPDDQVAERLSDLIDMIPTDLIAAQVESFTSKVSPERVSQEAHNLVGKMPSSGAVADIVHGVAGEASKSLGDVAKAKSLDDAKAILAEFIGNAKDIVSKTVANDNAAKKKFDKKGGDFDL